MALDPLKIGINLQSVSLLNFGENVFNDVFIFYCFASRCLPAVLAPINIPCGDTINGISAIGDDYSVTIPGGNFECSRDRREFGALVGLPGSWQGFRNIPVMNIISKYQRRCLACGS